VSLKKSSVGKFEGLSPVYLPTKYRRKAMNFQTIYESAKKRTGRKLREDSFNYELVDPAAGFQPAKKAVATSRTDDRTEYFYPDGTSATEWLPV
jgi:hypothetical protein